MQKVEPFQQSELQPHADAVFFVLCFHTVDLETTFVPLLGETSAKCGETSCCLIGIVEDMVVEMMWTSSCATMQPKGRRLLQTY